MGIRYTRAKTVINEDKQIRPLLKRRGLKRVRQYVSNSLPYPTAEQISRMELVQHVWGIGDKFYKLAHQYYGDTTLWWVIAWVNQPPTEANLKQGDVVHIALDIDDLIEILGL